jgi:protein transport protein SEC61 subunit alpha
LNDVVPTAAMLGGVVIGLLTIVGDIFGVIGSSTGLLLSVNIIYGYMSKIQNARDTSKAVKFY